MAKDKLAEGGWDVEVWDGGVGGAPGGIEAGLGRALDAEEIDAPDCAGIEIGCQAIHGEGDFRDPKLLRGLHGDAAAETAAQILGVAMCDIEIDPHAIGTDFEFFVAQRIRRVWLEKDFGDVAVPELVAAAGGFGIGKDGDGAIAGVEPDEQRCWRPEEADFGFAPGVGIFAPPVRAETQRCGGDPLRCGWETIRVGLTW
jgi:hypothetical protein